MMRRHLGYLMAGAGDGRWPTLKGIARDRSAMVFITVAFVGLAAVLTRATASRLELRRLSQESTEWPGVPGEVVDTRPVWSSSPRAGKSYWPTVHFRYAVGGTQFLGDRVSFRPSYGRAEAEDGHDNTSILQLMAERFGEPGEIYSHEVLGRTQQGIASVSAVLDATAKNTAVCSIGVGDPVAQVTAVVNSDLRRAFEGSLKTLSAQHPTELCAKYPELRINGNLTVRHAREEFCAVDL